MALVGNDHAVKLAAAFVKVERTQIDPGAAAHLLVDAELRGFAFVPDNVMGIVNTLRQRLIADIHGIAPGCRQGGLVGDETVLFLLLGGLHLSGTSCCKGILAVMVIAAVLCKTVLTRAMPPAVIVHLNIGNARVIHVVIDNHLIALPVAFAW